MERASGKPGGDSSWGLSNRFLNGWLRKLSRKLDLPSLDFKFRSLWASDLIGRTQAFQRLVQGGMGIQEAVSAAGIMAE